ncbi:hypothetical protein B0H13DRAFT_916104 [Mycena leptocephala]|nr:hypothetical protein B0H13DRAFT_916104 [Mycena leptocephala]
MKDWQTSPASIKWALHVIPSLEHRFISLQAVMQYFLDQFPENVPSLDLPSFTNYLCCVNSLLSPVEPRLMVQTNKSSFRDLLMTQLFERLLDSTLDPLVIARIIKLTAKLAPKLTGERRGFIDLVKLIKQTSRFLQHISTDGGWLDVAVSATQLTRVDDVTEFRTYMVWPHTHSLYIHKCLNRRRRMYSGYTWPYSMSNNRGQRSQQCRFEQLG